MLTHWSGNTQQIKNDWENLPNAIWLELELLAASLPLGLCRKAQWLSGEEILSLFSGHRRDECRQKSGSGPKWGRCSLSPHERSDWSVQKTLQHKDLYTTYKRKGGKRRIGIVHVHITTLPFLETYQRARSCHWQTFPWPGRGRLEAGTCGVLHMKKQSWLAKPNSPTTSNTLVYLLEWWVAYLLFLAQRRKNMQCFISELWHNARVRYASGIWPPPHQQAVMKSMWWSVCNSLCCSTSRDREFL